MKMDNVWGYIFATLLVGGTAPWWLNIVFKKQPEPASIPPITQPSTAVPQPSGIPSQNPTQELCPSQMTFGELDALNAKNNLQAKDVCDKQTIILTGYLRSDSVYECSHTNDLKQKVETRCLRVYYNEGNNSQTFFIATTEQEKQMFADINRKLYKDGDYSIQIRSTISFLKRDTYQYIDYSNIEIITYQPLKKV